MPTPFLRFDDLRKPEAACKQPVLLLYRPGVGRRSGCTRKAAKKRALPCHHASSRLY